MTLQVLVRDASGAVAGIAEPEDLKLVCRFNDVGTWQLSAALDDVPGALLQRGAAVVITDEYGHVMSGPVVDFEILHDKDHPDGHVTLNGFSDEAFIQRRCCFPDPDHDPTAQAVPRRIITGVASTVLRAYVNENTGPGALAARRSGLVLEATDPLIGATITGTARFHNLLDEIRVLAVAGGGLGFRVTRTLTGAPTFEVFQPEDKTASIVLSRGTNTLEESKYSLKAPTGTYAIAGGQGTLENRTFRFAVDTATEADWGDRFEVFHDSNSEDDTDKIQQDADTKLKESGETGSVSFVPIDSPDIQIRRDYWLGDKITVDIGKGVRVQNVIREIEIVANLDGVVYRPRAGDENATATPADRKKIADALRQIRELQVR